MFVVGMLFARKVLSVCWDAILDVLSVLTSGRSSCGISGSLALLFNAKEESRRAREAICVSLEGLQRAARLSSILGQRISTCNDSDKDSKNTNNNNNKITNGNYENYEKIRTVVIVIVIILIGDVEDDDDNDDDNDVTCYLQ